MKIYKFLLILVLPLIVTAPKLVKAQEEIFTESEEEADQNMFRKLSHRGNIEDAKSLGAPFMPQSMTDFWNDSTSDFGPFTYDGNLWTNDDESGESTNWSGERKHDINAQGPLSGMMTGLNAGAIVDLYTENLAGPVPMLFATVNLTEPGIGFGLANAAQNVAQLLSHQYQFDQQLHNRAMTNPETGEIVYKNFVSCVSRKLEGEATSVWEAQALCTPGETVKLDGGGSDIFPAPEGSDGFTWSDDPNGAEASGEEILLTNYLFDQEKESATASDPSLEDLIEPFKEIIGDVSFTYEDVDSSGGKSFAKVVKIKRVPATKPPAQFYKALVKQRYEDLKAILIERCNFENEGNVSDDENDGDFYVTNTESQKMLVRLSAKGARMKPGIIESLFWVFLKEETDRTIDSTGKYEVKCDLINNAGAFDDWDLALSSDNMKYLSRRLQLMFGISQRIGFAQYMETLGKAEEVIRKLTGGTSETIYRKYGLELVYSAAGTSDLRTAVQRSNELYKEQMQILFGEYLKDQAELGAKVAPMFADTGGGSNVDSAVDLEADDEA